MMNSQIEKLGMVFLPSFKNLTSTKYKPFPNHKLVSKKIKNSFYWLICAKSVSVTGYAPFSGRKTKELKIK